MKKDAQNTKMKITNRDARTFWRVVILTGTLSSIPLVILVLVFFPKSSRDMPNSYSGETTPIESVTTNGAVTTKTTETTVTVPSSTSFSEEASEAVNPETYRKEAKEYYPTFQKAIDVYSLDSDAGASRVSGKVLQFESKDAVIAYYWCINRYNLLGFNSVFSVKKDGKYSNILEYGSAWEEAYPAQSFYPFTFAYTFTPDETVASYLPDQCFNVDIRSIPNGGAPIYLGISNSPSAKNLRILGKPPTRIIKSSVRGKIYYIWIYEGLDIRGVLLNTKGFTFGKFTYGQLIDILHIHFASNSDPLSKNVPITTAN